MIGGCPLKSAYDFRIPTNAPVGNKVLFAWTWFNKIGNREMYMNCALVDIIPASGANASQDLYSGVFDGPSLFKANIFGGTCQTPHGVDIVFPNPGQSVEYGGPYTTSKPIGPTILTGCPPGENVPGPLPELPQSSITSNTGSTLTETGTATSTNTDASTTSTSGTSTESVSTETWTTITGSPTTRPESSQTTSRTSALPSSPPMITDAGNGGIATMTVTHTVYTTVYQNSSGLPAQSSSITTVTTTCTETVTPSIYPVSNYKATASNASFSDPPKDSLICVPGKTICKDLHQLAMCVDDNFSHAVSVGRLPPDTVCIDGSMVRVRRGGRLGDCEKAKTNSIHCLGESEWALCDGRYWVDMGLVPGGLKCVNGNMERV